MSLFERRYSVADALAVGLAVKAGEARLLSPVVFHRQQGNVSIRWEAQQPLAVYRARLKKSLESRLKCMEACDHEHLPPDEYERLCVRYEQYSAWCEELNEQQTEMRRVKLTVSQEITIRKVKRHSVVLQQLENDRAKWAIRYRGHGYYFLTEREALCFAAGRRWINVPLLEEKA